MNAEKMLTSYFQKFTEINKDISIDIFYNQIYSTVKLYVYKNQNFGKQQCIEYACTLFDRALKDVNINSLLTSLAIFDCLNEAPPYITTDLTKNSLIEKIEQLFDQFRFITGVPNNASYSYKECMEKVISAAQSKNNISIFRELQPFYNGGAFEIFRTNIMTVIIKYLWFIDKKKIIDYLNEDDWSFKMENVLFSLKENAKDIILETLNSKSQYPAIRAMKFFIETLNEKNFQEKTNECNLPIYCEILKNFIYSYSTILNDLKYPLGFLNSNHFNYIAGLCVNVYESFLQKYLFLIKDLSDDARIAFSHGYLQSAKQKTITNDSWVILNYWKESSISIHDSVNKFNGLEKLLILGLSTKYSSKEELLTELKEILSKIINVQNSWGERVVQKDLYVMFCLVLANKQKNYHFSKEELLQELPFLFDERYSIKYEAYIFETMKQILMNPSEVNEIHFKDSVNNGERILYFQKQ